jgi:hypothetical protein
MSSNCRRCRRELRVEERADEGGARHELVQQADSLGLHLVGQQREAGRVSARPVETVDEAGLDGITAHAEDDGDRRGRPLGRNCRDIAARSHEHGYPAAHEIGCQGRQPLVLTMRPAILDGDVPAFDETGIPQALPERSEQVRGILRRPAAHPSDHRQPRRLRPRRQRPEDGRRGRACE